MGAIGITSRGSVRALQMGKRPCCERCGVVHTSGV